MTKLLLHYDGKDSLDALLLDLSRSGLPDTLRVRIVCVADVWVPPRTQLDPAQEEALPDEIRRARSRALQVVQVQETLARQVSDRLKSAFPQWQLITSSLVGPPPQTVAAAAQEWGADLVMMQWRDQSRLRRLLSENPMEKVALLAPCSVRVARPPVRRVKRAPRILVAIDGSTAAAAAVQAVADRSWPAGSTFQVVTVLDPTANPEDYRSTFYADDWMNQHNASAGDIVSQLVESAAERMRSAGLTVQTHKFEGKPGPLLLRHTQESEVDGLFLGATGSNHGERRSLGRLASWLTARAPCSIEMVRPAAVHLAPFRTVSAPALVGTPVGC